jgi:DNA replication licensing factor MCM4
LSLRQAKILNRSCYLSGKGTTVAGLTATVINEGDGCRVEEGALVRSNEGIVCIDEFDKMDDNTRRNLLESMQQGTVSISMRGMTCKLAAKVSIFACMNFADGGYDPAKPPSHNIVIPPYLFSRFSLVKIVSSNLDTRKMKEINRMVSIGYNDQRSSSRNSYSFRMLKRYVEIARGLKEPLVDGKILEPLVKKYVDIRELFRTSSPSDHQPTLRFFEGSINIAIAYARLRHATRVNKYDVEDTIRILDNHTMTFFKAENIHVRSSPVDEVAMVTVQILFFIDVGTSISRTEILNHFKKYNVRHINTAIRNLVREGYLAFVDDKEENIKRL